MAVTWALAHGRTLLLDRARVMGILNVTPDSFSDGGRHMSLDMALVRAREMIDEGADMVDVGGESTRPGAAPVDEAEEQRRVLPVVEALAELDAAISIDTRRASTARAAVERGAHVVNDVTGLRGDGDMADVVAETGAGLVAMHNSRLHKARVDPIADQRAVFDDIAQRCDRAGIESDAVMFDPGIGFGKDAATNWALLARLDEVVGFGMPVLLGTSRKRFLGSLTGRDADARDVATAATSVAGRMAGALVFRVHDVRANVDALKVADRLMSERT